MNRVATMTTRLMTTLFMMMAGTRGLMAYLPVRLNTKSMSMRVAMMMVNMGGGCVFYGDDGE